MAKFVVAICIIEFIILGQFASVTHSAVQVDTATADENVSKPHAKISSPESKARESPVPLLKAVTGTGAGAGTVNVNPNQNQDVICEDGKSKDSENYCYKKKSNAANSEFSKREISLLQKIKLVEIEYNVELNIRSGTAGTGTKPLETKNELNGANSDEEGMSDTENMETVKCSLYTKLVNEDLKPFSKGISKDMIDAGRNSGIFYQIVDGKLYREKDCNFPSRCSGIEHFLVKLLNSKSTDLPNMELIINVSDWPRVNAWSTDLVPVLSFSKNKNYADITYPAWTFWEGGPALSIYPRGIGRWDLMRKSLISISEKLQWNEKKSLGFFRGSRTSNERDALVLLSRKYPQLVDAQYTKNQAWKSDADTLNAPAASEVSFEKHCDYKYLFNYRGVAASFRFKHLFLCRSLVFHVGNEWIEFFYPALKPWIHYVPVETTASENDLKFLLEFFQAHDDLASKIGNRGYEFIKSNLQLAHIECYWRQLLTKYGELITYHAELRKDVIPIL